MTLDEFLTSRGLKPHGEECAGWSELDGFADALAAAVEDFGIDNLALVTAATATKITAVNYLIADTLTKGIKQDMAEVLDVTTQALWQYEKRNNGIIKMLRPEFDTQVRLAWMKSQRRRG